MKCFVINRHDSRFCRSAIYYDATVSLYLPSSYLLNKNTRHCTLLGAFTVHVRLNPSSDEYIFDFLPENNGCHFSASPCASYLFRFCYNIITMIMTNQAALVKANITRTWLPWSKISKHLSIQKRKRQGRFSQEDPLVKSKVAELSQKGVQGKQMMSVHENAKTAHARVAFKSSTIDTARKRLVNLGVFVSNMADAGQTYGSEPSRLKDYAYTHGYIPMTWALATRN